jgi:hypothetical protein
MKRIRYIISLAVALSVCPVYGDDFRLSGSKTLSVACLDNEENPVGTALDLFSRDYRRVFSSDIKLSARLKGASVIVGTVGSKLLSKCGVDLTPLTGLHEAFMLTVTADGRLVIAGSDRHGTAYGVMELSRLIGVSPWEWWADATPRKRDSFTLREGYSLVESPSVDYRGIFINDEDWGLNPWSWQNYEPGDVKGQIGPRTHERIFELLLRLRANTFWPAMHECSVPFFFTPGNREVAERYGIYIGTSHCEPMMRNTNGEWRRDGVGEYDFVNNRENVLDFWRKRVEEVATSNNIFTLGMRGVHDGAMNGAKTIDEQKSVLTRVIAEQRRMIADYVTKDVTSVPQVFIPYKEVLDVYNAGLRVPDDVTLMWCDDNYGFIRHFPTAAERERSGGNGIYYHTSYWGRPHDYLWISGTNPSLIIQQMALAYERGIQRMWILNVGDIKPLEYQTELFLDMAWNVGRVVDRGVENHLAAYLTREFGEKAAAELLPVMRSYYRLSYIRRPEFLGNTRTEERDPAYKVISDLPWSDEEITSRLAEYRKLSDAVELVKSEIPAEKADCYYQLVEYPVKAAAQMNRKLLTAQLARHGKCDWSESDAAFDSIASLTERYNTPKWRGIMDFQPRRLPVFERVKHVTVTADGEKILTEASKADEGKQMSDGLQSSRLLARFDGADYASGNATLCPGLGYGGRAVAADSGDELTYNFADCESDSVSIVVGLLPSHPVEGNTLRFALSVDDGEPRVVDYHTEGRSEEWKQNILRGQAQRTLTLPVGHGVKNHRLTFRAMDEGVVLDEIAIYK